MSIDEMTNEFKDAVEQGNWNWARQIALALAERCAGNATPNTQEQYQVSVVVVGVPFTSHPMGPAEAKAITDTIWLMVPRLRPRATKAK